MPLYKLSTNIEVASGQKRVLELTVMAALWVFKPNQAKANVTLKVQPKLLQTA